MNEGNYTDRIYDTLSIEPVKQKSTPFIKNIPIVICGIIFIGAILIFNTTRKTVN